MQIVELPKKTTTPQLEEALEVLDIIRQRLASGEIKSFVAVGISAEHETFMFSASAAKTTKLEMLGAVTHLQQCFMAEN